MTNNKLKAKIIETFGSQANFAQELGVFEPVISRVIRGRVQLPDNQKIRWAALLDCKPTDIFNNESETTKEVVNA